MTTKPERWLTSEDLADILQVSLKTIQNRLSMLGSKPGILPPLSKPPGCRGARWSPRIVAEWQAKYDPATAEPSGKRRVGRPTKAEQIAKRMSQSVANN